MTARTPPAWAEEDELKPAPEPLLLVQSFVNTRDLDLGTDTLAETETANAWLRAAGLLAGDGTAGPAELRAVRAVREDIRALLARNAHPGSAPAGDLPALGALTRDGRLRVSIDPAGQVQAEPEHPARLTDGLLRLLLIISDAQRDGTWARLKACGNDDCQWAFYDRSHSRRGAWCDMAGCGNKIKNRNLRARRGSRPRQARPERTAP